MWSHERNIRSIIAQNSNNTSNSTANTDTKDETKSRVARSKGSSVPNIIEFKSENVLDTTEGTHENVTESKQSEEEAKSNTLQQYYLTEETSRRVKILAERCNAVINTMYRLKLVIVIGLIMVNAVTLFYVLYMYFTSSDLVDSSGLWKTAGIITVLNTLPPALAIGLCSVPNETK